MLRKSARGLIGLAVVEFGLLAILVSVFGLSLKWLFVAVVAITAVGVSASMRQLTSLLTSTRPPPGPATSGVKITPEKATDGAMRAFGGLLMAFPGLLSGIVGLILLFPPVRKSLAPVLWTRIERRLPPELSELHRAMRGENTRGRSGFGRGDVVDVDVASAEPDRSGQPNSATRPELH